MDLDILNAPIEIKFYDKNIKGLSDEIVLRAHLDMGIEITNSHTEAHTTKESESSPVEDKNVISGNEYDVLKDDAKTNEKEQVRPKYRKTYDNVTDVDVSPTL